MRSHGMFGSALLAGIVFVQSSSVPAQEDGAFELRDVDVTVEDGRLVLSTVEGASYQLAALEVPEECPAAGGGLWACGEGSRQSLAAAVKGEVLECRIVEPGSPPSVECYAQTRNLNQWMLEVGRAKLYSAWVRGSIPAYDAAERVARAAGAMLWDASEPELTLLTLRFPVPAPPLGPGGVTEGGQFLGRGMEGFVRTYEVFQPERDVRVDYLPYDQELPMRSGDSLGSYVAAIGVGDGIVHPAAEGQFAFTEAPSRDGVVPLAYIVNSDTVAGRSYTTILLDQYLAWTPRRGVLQPVRAPLGSRTERRGATAVERRAIGEGLPEDGLRAGVWTYDRFRVVVAEDPLGCERYMWCRFAVLDEGNEVVVFDIAREAPELAVLNAGAVSESVTVSPDVGGLVWETPGGVWKQWSP